MRQDNYKNSRPEPSTRKGSCPPLAQYRDVWQLVGENKASKAEVSYRLARLRRYGLARWEAQEGVRLWGLTKKSRAALRKKTA